MKWQDLFADEIIEDAFEYIKQNQYRDLETTKDELNVTLLGKKEYKVKIQYKDGSIADMRCSCLYGISGVKCEHMAAACIMGEVSKKITDAVVEEPQGQDEPEEENYQFVDYINETSGDY